MTHVQTDYIHSFHSHCVLHNISNQKEIAFEFRRQVVNLILDVH